MTIAIKDIEASEDGATKGLKSHTAATNSQMHRYFDRKTFMQIKY